MTRFPFFIFESSKSSLSRTWSEVRGRQREMYSKNLLLQRIFPLRAGSAQRRTSLWRIEFFAWYIGFLRNTLSKEYSSLMKTQALDLQNSEWHLSHSVCQESLNLGVNMDSPYTLSYINFYVALLKRDPIICENYARSEMKMTRTKILF